MITRIKICFFSGRTTKRGEGVKPPEPLKKEGKKTFIFNDKKKWPESHEAQEN